ncbi:endonuclease/exonuclease/phosphatase (EEP) superfamily protein YafD [Catalinimonas alkaloidigena]|uniref:endonuclease/exonuclease/phosphatase family protein n=1 Tax=Catalinimonas alkaloidigena TaxID=1075417 RepID=UPI0024071EA9|nr:endonuclease/exonuclease/phosphatase family protein [Catalinimonas alkaloidigena]MDF9797341.1 endonuclease/exonuclease/phosphatase (EEP) superfamily protein YafD [Catalinimonas alkaloidigena]
MLIVIIICTILTVLVTVLPLSQQTHWIIRGMDFPRLQIMIFSIVLLIAIVFFLDERLPLTLILIFTTVLCLIWQLWWILPYTPLWQKEVKSCNECEPERKLSIITSNVLTPNRNADALIELVNKYQPDILVTLESDKWWEKQLKGLESVMPFTVKCPLDNLYGMHLYSKLRLHDQEISFLVENDVPSIHVSLELRTGDRVRAHFIHPAPPSPTENTESAERDAELIVIARSVVKSTQPILVTGDLNDVAWSSTTRLFRKISGLLDPRIGRGMFNTFHAKYPLLRWPLDHLFHSDHFTLLSIKRLPSIGSDHFPLFTSLAFTPVKGASQEGLESDSEDHDRAKEIADEKGVSKKDVPQPNEKN